MDLRPFLKVLLVFLAINGIKASDKSTEKFFNSLTSTLRTDFVNSTTSPQSNLATQVQGNTYKYTNGTMSYSPINSASRAKSSTPQNERRSSDIKITSEGMPIPAIRAPNDKNPEEIKTSRNSLLSNAPENDATTSHSHEQNTLDSATTSSSFEDSSTDTNTKDLSNINPSVQPEAEGILVNYTNTLELAETMEPSSQSAETTIINESTLNTATPIQLDFKQWNGTVGIYSSCTKPYEDAVLPKVLVGGYNGVYWADGSEKRLPALVSKRFVDAYSVDYHYEKGYVFYSAFHTSILRMNIDHIHPTGCVTKVLTVTDDVQLAVDWVRDELYWMSAKNKTIMKANLDGNKHTLIYLNISSNFSYPRNLVIDPYAGYLFFVDSESVFRIDLSYNSVQEVELSMDDPGAVTCVALERHERRLYFSGINDDTYIASSRYDGTDVRIHNITTSEPWNVIFSIDAYRDSLIIAHYSEEDGDSLFEAQLSNNSARKIFIPSKPKEGIAGIRIYHSNVQSPIDSRTCLEEEYE